MGCGEDDRREGKREEGVIRSKHLRGGTRSKENRINGGQDRMEGNIVSLSQHDYYGSLLHNHTCITYIE